MEKRTTIKPVIEYICSKCKTAYRVKDVALRCEESHGEHKFNVGDVFLTTHFPGDYSVTEYLIISELTWEEPRRKGNPCYRTKQYSSRRSTFKPDEIVLTNKQRLELKEKAEDLIENIPEDLIFNYYVEWNTEYGTYQIEMLLNKNEILNRE